MPALLATCGDVVQLWEQQQDDTLALAGSVALFKERTNAVAWNHNAQVLCACSDSGAIGLVHESGRVLDVLNAGAAEPAALHAIAFSSKSRFLVTGGTAQRVDVWDLKKKAQIRALRGHAAAITCAQFDARDEHIASGAADGALLLHNLRSGAVARTLAAAGGALPGALAVRCDPARPGVMASAHADGSVYLWDANAAEAGGAVAAWRESHRGAATDAQFSPASAALLASCGRDGAVVLRDTRQRGAAAAAAARRVDCGGGGGEALTGLSFRGDGAALAAGSESGGVFVVDLRRLGGAGGGAAARVSAGHCVMGVAWQLTAAAATPSAVKRSRVETDQASLTGDQAHSSDHGSATAADAAAAAAAAARAVATAASNGDSGHGAQSRAGGAQAAAPPPPPSQSSLAAAAAAAAAAAVAGTPAPPRRFSEHTPRRDSDSNSSSVSAHQQHSKSGSLLWPRGATAAARMSPTAAAAAAAAAAQPVAAAPAAALTRDAFEDGMAALLVEVRRDMRNLHLDVLRQFETQQSELHAMLARHAGEVAALLAENEALRRENEDLRRLY
ncbi:WD40-repeat-containing domain protein [Tribonema minus]|uniref:WD40-repeat-containing domain protein n=1 Tax=Tribonema minus TaxID=303371 RepID=A0A835Z084_9STRA|nr:WD40-repeat-containing domain protein [Tribonema minus]